MTAVNPTGLRRDIEGTGMIPSRSVRIAFIVSHPIQYYAPLYQRLAKREHIEIKVFFTWHAGEEPVRDRGFGVPVAWDIPVTQGYEFERVPNLSSEPGTHHFGGLRNPALVDRVVTWRPDVVHVTGWAWHSHLLAMRAFYKRGIPILFWGDSHLLDGRQGGLRWHLKRVVLGHVFSWPIGFLFVGQANRQYYQEMGVTPDRLFPCPHSVDVGRFAEPRHAFETEAARWRHELAITPDQCVILFAGKFEAKKRPLELMQAVQELNDDRIVLVMVGNGELETEVHRFARKHPRRFRVLPFQNQSQMPVVYRLGDLFVLPSGFGETWGLAVNEALACGRPVLVSDVVGCAADVVDNSCGGIFSWADPASLSASLQVMTCDLQKLRSMRRAAAKRAWSFDVSETEAALVNSVSRIHHRGKIG